MIERGTVTAVHPGVVDVSIEPSPACAGCGACSEGASGSRLLSGVVDTLDARVGDIVEVETPLQARRRAQGLVYVVPVAALIAGYLAGFLLSEALGIAGRDTVGAVVGLAAGALALFSVRYAERMAKGSSEFEPHVRAIISRGQERR